MTIVRDNPLPIGRYWVDVPVTKLNDFQDWLSRWKGSVVVETTETGDEVTFFIFKTLNPSVMWEGPGLPTIAANSVSSKDDTTERPDPEDLDPFPDMPNAGGFGFGLGAGIAVVAIGFYLLGRRK